MSMPGEYTFTLGTNCIENLKARKIQKVLQDLYADGTIDIHYPTIYEQAEEMCWYLVVVRRDGLLTPARCLETGDRDEAIARVQYLCRPVFEPPYIERGIGSLGEFDDLDRMETNALRRYLPELAHWCDAKMRFAWGMYSRVVHGVGFCDILGFCRRTPRDESFLDYVWHFKIIGSSAHYPPELKETVGEFLSKEAAIWRKWKKTPLLLATPAGSPILGYPTAIY